MSLGDGSSMFPWSKSPLWGSGPGQVLFTEGTWALPGHGASGWPCRWKSLSSLGHLVDPCPGQVGRRLKRLNGKRKWSPGWAWGTEGWTGPDTEDVKLWRKVQQSMGPLGVERWQCPWFAKTNTGKYSMNTWLCQHVSEHLRPRSSVPWEQS